MQKTVGVIQARMGSRRFPGKMLAKLGDYPIIEWVLSRSDRSHGIDELILATTGLPSDDVLSDCAKHLGIEVYRGDETDVLNRVTSAAKKLNANQVVRICADNPFVDPQEIDRLINYFDNSDCDYAWNDQPREGGSYSDGFGAEILSMKLLEDLNIKVTELFHREHVTMHLWSNCRQFTLLPVPAPPALAHPDLSFDIDEPLDLARLENFINAKSVDYQTSAEAIVKMMLEYSDTNFLE